MKALSLFSGIGGMDLGAELAGIETIAFCEFASFPRAVLKKHWPDVPIFEDIRTLNTELLEREGINVESIELVHGGFPCQPYSIAGKQLGKEDDRDLWPEMFRIIQEVKPRWIIGENVANFANMELERTLIDLEGEGYETQSFIIPACGVNAKHQRSRTFIVAYSESVDKGGLPFRETKKHSGLTLGRKNAGSTGSKRYGREERRIKLRRAGSQWKSEPSVGRVAHGVPGRVDRLKSLGNAVVPQQIYPLFKAIMDIEKAC